MADASWSPSHYLAFADERTRPARDLLAAVPLASARRVVDIGCGPGNSTELLVERYPGAEVIGIDNSETMLAAATARLPDVSFIAADVSGWSPPPGTDLLYSNAAFQWVPQHLDVMARVFAAVASGAVLAVQMPDNLDGPSHRLMQRLAEEGPWAAKFAKPIARERIHPPAVYRDRLMSRAARVDIWHTTYYHPLRNAAAIVEMIGSTGLRPYLARLEEGERDEYLRRYEAEVADGYERTADGILYRFPRLFIVAIKG